MSLLYIVATPIGNLEDTSSRALRILGEVDMIVCEDTRVTKKLLDRYHIHKPLISYHAHSPEKRILEIVDLLKDGKNLALVSDAGTPGINDPGGALVERVVRTCGDTVVIVPLPGPSTVATVLSISGFPAERFVYLGFSPHKKGREKFFREVASRDETVVFLESPYRILKALASLEA
ncbi:16S rRNA (cytidine(1402)-2'-O)-methyltransferase, partial [Candidatus Uhrbacteria bacterium]|nr:16S rRNA (cytidine(1402)-2'-O)-methyltransferase [Candidatus Uhrbacteria bacterium]